MGRYIKTIDTNVNIIDIDTNEETNIPMPISFEYFFPIQLSLMKKNIKLKNVTNGCNIDFEISEEDIINPLKCCIRLEYQLETLNILSDYDEVVALTECGITKISELVKIIQEGKYHFYNNGKQSTIKHLYEIATGECYDPMYEDDEVYYIYDLARKGYYVCSTGILYLPEEKEITRDEITALREVWLDRDNILQNDDNLKYKFYPNTTLEQVADSLKVKYKDFEEYTKKQILNNMKTYNYVKTSTGVIQVIDEIINLADKV